MSLHQAKFAARTRGFLGKYFRDVMKSNKQERNFRVFGPDETSSNRLEALFEVTSRAFMGTIREDDDDLWPRWSCYGNSKRTYLPRMARRLLAYWSPRPLLMLRSLYSYNRFNVQPTCKNGSKSAKKTSMAQTDCLA